MTILVNREEGIPIQWCAGKLFHDLTVGEGNPSPPRPSILPLEQINRTSDSRFLQNEFGTHRIVSISSECFELFTMA